MHANTQNYKANFQTAEKDNTKDQAQTPKNEDYKHRNGKAS